MADVVEDTPIVWVRSLLINEDAFSDCLTHQQLMVLSDRFISRLLKLVSGVVNSGRFSRICGREVNAKTPTRSETATRRLTAYCRCCSALTKPVAGTIFRRRSS